MFYGILIPIINVSNHQREPLPDYIAYEKIINEEYTVDINHVKEIIKELDALANEERKHNNLRLDDPSIIYIGEFYLKVMKEVYKMLPSNKKRMYKILINGLDESLQKLKKERVFKIVKRVTERLEIPDAMLEKMTLKEKQIAIQILNTIESYVKN